MMLAALLRLSLILGASSAQFTVNINTTLSIFETEEEFISFCLDSYLFAPEKRVDWNNFDRTSPKMKSLLRGMSPTLLRVGGSPADFLFFDIPYGVINVTSLSRKPIVMTKTDWDDLVRLTLTTGNRLLFDLNLQTRYGTQWDPTQSIRLFEYCREKGYGENLDWELGNEPDAYSFPGQITPSLKQMALDFVNLRKVIESYPSLKGGRIVGPDRLSMNNKSMSDFVDLAGGYVEAATLHHYYFRGDTAHWTDYISPKHFGSDLPDHINSAKSVIATSKHPELKLWIGETSDAWHSGTAGVSDRFVSAFLWLDKLGISAKLGVGVVMRQTWYGHNYPVISNTMDPNPDYWLSLMHKRLAGRRVLQAEVNGSTNSTVRVYAHCTNPEAGFPAGAVTGFGLNIENSTQQLVFGGQFQQLPYELYLMTAGEGDQKGLLSKFVKLNGHVLTLLPDSSLPEFTPMSQPAGAISLPAYSYAFWVFPDAKAKACM